MRYFPRRASRKMDISLLLKVCPNCLGDLVHRSDLSGDYFHCLQCNGRATFGMHADRLTGVRNIAETIASPLTTSPGLLPPSITIP